MAHTNGDAAADQLIGAVEKANEKHPVEDPRTVMIHAQIVRGDQLNKMKEINIIPSFFVSHTFFWGDWHRDSVLGKKRAYSISPAKSALDKNITFTFHNDSPVAPVDITPLLWSGVTRVSRSGDIIGPDERVSIMDAIKAVTINAAYQNFEEDTKGSIEVGKIADLVVLSENPLNVDPMEIRNINVLYTYKEGKLIYSAN